MFSRQRIFDRFINWYPPFLGAGIRMVHRETDWSALEVQMKMRWWNRNYVGVHYGGSLYSMCDPWFMLILIKQLGPDFIVWDKAATIRFKRPGKGAVSAKFSISSSTVKDIRSKALELGKFETTLMTQVVDENGGVIAEVEKLLYVRMTPVRSKA